MKKRIVVGMLMAAAVLSCACKGQEQAAVSEREESAQEDETPAEAAVDDKNAEEAAQEDEKSVEEGTVEPDQEDNYDFTLYEQEMEWGFLYDKEGEWWSECYENANGGPLAYCLRLETAEGEPAMLSYTYGSDKLCYTTVYGDFWLLNEESGEYGYHLYMEDSDRDGTFFMTCEEDTLTVTEGEGDAFFQFTDTAEISFQFNPDPQLEIEVPELSGYDDIARVAYSTLTCLDEIRYYKQCGMVIQYRGETQEINGEPCIVFEMGTDHEEQFVREFYYAVSPDDLTVYSYDVLSDTWNVIGQG